MILDEEKVKYEDDVTVALARLGNGSMRDALSVLDQLLSTGIEPLTLKAFEEFLGQPNRQKLSDLIGKIGDSDAAGVLTAIDELLNTGQSAPQIVVSHDRHNAGYPGRKIGRGKKRAFDFDLGRT